MMRIYACALLVTLGACGKNASKHDAGMDFDMAVKDTDGGGGHVDDLSVTDHLDGGTDADSHQPLRLVPDAVPLKVDGGADYYELHVKPGPVQIQPGPPTTIWGFNGMWPGPTVHATLGRPTTIRVFNELPVNENLTIHNHGHNVAPAYDGHPSNNTISPSPAPVNWYDYHYPNMQQGGTPPNIHGAGTYFFHDHEMGLTAPHFYKGVEAFYLIHPQAGSDEANLNLPSGAYDIPLMIQDRTFTSDNTNTLDYNVSFINGFQGAVMVVNGTAHPYLSVARRKYRFRLLNASNARNIDVTLDRGSMFQISTDGGLLPQQLSPIHITMGPAERVDIVIDFSQYKIGDVVTLQNDEDSFQPLLPEILQFRIDRDEAETSSLPVNLNNAFVKYTEANPTVTRTRSLVIEYDAAGGEWTLNGRTYDPNAFEFGGTQLGDVEIWSLVNSDAVHPIPHPFHQHLIEFQILDICPVANPGCGVAPLGPQSGWKDVVLVPPGMIARIKMPFYYNGPEPPASIFPGPYVFHCHNLEHEDHAMMLQQMVSPSPTPHP